MRRFLPLLLLTFAIACKKENSNSGGTVEQTYMDISYRTGTQQKMDIYLPAGRDTTNTKLMILIHGGAWTEGDKADFTAAITEIKNQLPDYAFANINYRLYSNGQNTFPAQEEDIKAAVTFLAGKKADYRFANKLVLLGASAGAHLALLQGYKFANMMPPQAIISFFGPTDLTDLYNHPGYPLVPSILAGIIGATPTQNPSIYSTSSPINYVSGQSAPTLLLQGDADILVPVNQAYLLNDRLQLAGVTHQLVIYPGEEHGFTDPAMNDAISRAISFLHANVP